MTKRPKKPSKKAGYVVYGADGSVATVIETPPTDPGELETWVVAKFQKALVAKGIVTELKKKDQHNDWPDLEGKLDDSKLGVEVVESVLAHEMIVRRQRELFTTALLNAIDDVADRLAGLYLNLWESCAVLPALKSKEGQAVLKLLETWLRDHIGHFAKLEPTRDSRVEELITDDVSKIQLWPTVTRVAAPEVPFRMRFSSGINMTGIDVDAALPDAVKVKLDKHYGGYGGKLWLLIYEMGVSGLFGTGQARAKALLDGRDHRFEKVWFFAVGPGDNGELHLLWQKA